MEKKLLKKLTHNLGYKISAILLAVILWLVVVNIEDPNKTDTIRNIPIELLNADTITDQGKVYSITSGDTAYVKVKGPRSYIDKLDAGDFTATADFNTLSITNAVTVDVVWSDDSGTLSKRVEILDSTSTISVELEDIKSRTYDVNINYTGKIAEDYIVNDAILSKETIVVTAPKSILDKISYVALTVDITDKTEDFSANIQPKLYNDTGEEIFQDENTSVSNDLIAVDIQLYKTKSVPISVYSLGLPATGYELYSLSLNREYAAIKGKSEDIDQISNVTISSEDVNITGAIADMEFNLSLDKYLPENIYLLDENTNSVTVKAVIVGQGVKSFTIKTSGVTFVNKPSNLKATITNPLDSITFWVKDASSSFNEASVVANIDLSGAVVGTASYTVNFTLPEGELVTAVKVDVTMEEITP